MSADWKRAPLPEGHEQDSLTHDGSDGMGRIMLAGLAVGAVLALGYWYRAERRMEHARQRAGISDHGDHRPATPRSPTVTGTLHLDRPDVDVDVGDAGWRDRGDVVGGQLYLPWGERVTAELGVTRTDRSHDPTASGLEADLARRWVPARDGICEPSDVRAGQAAIYCNNDPQHAWAWADGADLLYVIYEYADPYRQPDFGAIERIVASVR